MRRPFLATGDVWIGVKDIITVFNVNGEQVVFDVDYAMKYPRESIRCCRADIIEDCIQKVFNTKLANLDDFEQQEEAENLGN